MRSWYCLTDTNDKPPGEPEVVQGGVQLLCVGLGCLQGAARDDRSTSQHTVFSFVHQMLLCNGSMVLHMSCTACFYS